jgi:ABC-type amino acid transport substrate-binding protein
VSTRLARTAALALIGAAAVCRAEPEALRFVVPTNQSMPILKMQGSLPVDGLLKDLAEALAPRLGRRIDYVVLPSKRAATALMRDEADLHCYVEPGWLQGQLGLTRPFIGSAEVIAAGPTTLAPATLQALAHERLGTVLGYVHPKLEAELKGPILREDAVNAETNLRRLAVGRMRYAITDRLSLQFFIREHPGSGLREVAEVERHELSCAVGLRAAAQLPAINRALEQMGQDGSLERMLARYR